ncbi:MAG: flagellar filament capping protein FliD [Oscillospiraceae bacterium]|nr:flagellar filament capping protein FliD [Oscillospiraceae bacterium]
MPNAINTNRLVGMFSGLDTDGLVRALTMQQQSRVDALDVKMKQAEWKKDQLTDFNNKIRVFRDTYGSILGENNLMTKGAFSAFSVKMAENSGIQVTAQATAKSGNYNVRVDQLATAASIKGSKLSNRQNGLSDAVLSQTSISQITFLGGAYGSSDIRFTINDKEFNFNSANASLKSIMDAVNKADIGVTMSYSQMTDSISITNNAAGEKSTLAFSDDTGFLSMLGMTEVTAGQDAVVYLNGETQARRFDSNTVTLDGVTMSFMRTTGPGGIDFSLETDISPAVNRIKQFVDSYNELMKELFDAHTQKPNRNYKPLLDEQREQLSDKEIELWEEKAKAGLLYRDNTLGRLIENMRGVLTKTFGDFGNLASIGITTSRYVPGEPSKLELDESKLTAALQTNPDRVYGMFAEGSNALIPQLNKMMDDYVGTIKSRELQNLNNDINNYSKRIKEQEDKLIAMSEKYYLQYAKLETKLSQMQSHQESMSMMFGWGGNQ